MRGRPIRLFPVVTFLMLAVACKNKETAAEQAASDKVVAEREAAEAKRNAAVATRLESVAKLQGVVAALAPQPKVKPHPAFSLTAKGATPGSEANYDVLFTEQLADPSATPSVRVTREPALEGCKNTLQKRDTVFEYCKYDSCMWTCENLAYLVVLRTRSIAQPVIGTNTYTPGTLDADAFVFDLSTNKLVGGGRVIASNAGQGTAQGSNARNDIDDAFGKAVADAILAL